MQVDSVPMGSPLGPVPANIFMTELETIMIPSLRNFVQNWKWFADNIFAFVLPDKIVNNLNSLDENIQFTFKMRGGNKSAFCDVMVIRYTSEIINTIVYCKPTNTDIYINWHSYSPL